MMNLSLNSSKVLAAQSLVAAVTAELVSSGWTPEAAQAAIAAQEGARGVGAPGSPRQWLLDKGVTSDVVKMARNVLGHQAQPAVATQAIEVASKPAATPKASRFTRSAELPADPNVEAAQRGFRVVGQYVFNEVERYIAFVSTNANGSQYVHVRRLYAPKGAKAAKTWFSHVCFSALVAEKGTVEFTGKGVPFRTAIALRNSMRATMERENLPLAE